MYNVFKPNSLDSNEINEFIESSESAILSNETKSTLPSFTAPNTIDRYKELLIEKFSQPNLIYKQTKNGEPVYLRKATIHPELTEEGYLTLEYGLIKSYEGSKSFIFEQEFWDAWHEYLKSEGYIGWCTILAESATTEAYKKGIELGLFGNDVTYGPLKTQSGVAFGVKKIKVTF